MSNITNTLKGIVMSVTGYIRGYKIYINERDEKWYYSDTNELVTWESRPCGYCKLPKTSEGHDGCIANLPDVMSACCGHGETSEAYIQFVDKSVIRGSKAVIWYRSFCKNFPF